MGLSSFARLYAFLDFVFIINYEVLSLFSNLNFLGFTYFMVLGVTEGEFWSSLPSAKTALETSVGMTMSTWLTWSLLVLNSVSIHYLVDVESGSSPVILCELWLLKPPSPFWTSSLFTLVETPTVSCSGVDIT